MEGSEYAGNLSVVIINCDSWHITVVGKSRYFDSLKLEIQVLSDEDFTYRSMG